MTEDTYRDKLNSLQVEIEELRAKLKEAQTGDLISRQAAIDALTEYGNGRAVYISVEEAFSRIEQLPSAQPEIIRCKDCKHHDPEDKKCDCGHSILWQLPRDDDWYCADAERRTE